jgi:hypothetical protein
MSIHSRLYLILFLSIPLTIKYQRISRQSVRADRGMGRNGGKESKATKYPASPRRLPMESPTGPGLRSKLFSSPKKISHVNCWSAGSASRLIGTNIADIIVIQIEEHPFSHANRDKS